MDYSRLSTVRNIDKLIEKIVPPSDHQHRNGFSSEPIILSLRDNEKILVEKRLLEMLKTSNDNFIGDALVILKSKDAVPLFYEKMKSETEPSQKIIWADYINKIQGYDDEIKNLVLEEFDKITYKYSLGITFYSLARFNDDDMNNRIREHIDNDDYFIACNARKALGIDTKELLDRNKKQEIPFFKRILSYIKAFTPQF